LGWSVLDGIWRHKRQNAGKPADLDRSVDRSRGRKQRQLEPVALRTLVECHEKVQTVGVDERQAAEIEHQARASLEATQRGAQRVSDGGVERAAQRFDGGEVDLAAGLHDRDVVAPLDLDGEGEMGDLASAG
jgi:hypothetical protein